MPARIVFLGSPEFAVPSLLALGQDPRVEIALVVSQPDRPAGRGRMLRPPPVKTVAGELGLQVLQPESLKTDDAFDALVGARADVFVVVAYGELLRRRVLQTPPHGVLNVHPSLLPRYRGASPIPAAILNGDAESGVSVIKLVRALDAGPILRQRAVALDGTETAGALSRRLAAVGAEMLPDTVADWVAGRIPARPQDEAQVTYTRELTKDDARIDWGAGALEIERLVRAMHPWPAAWTVIGGKRLTVLAVDISLEPSQASPGIIVPHDHASTVVAADGIVRLLRVKPEGRPEMTGGEWLRGARLVPGSRFELR